MPFFSRTGNPEFSALTKVTGTLCASLHRVWRWAAPRRRQDWGPEGQGGWEVRGTRRVGGGKGRGGKKLHFSLSG